tara:strand:- start:7180 stop:7506 length:327 start_codon:yes stop_codon:yes gene_type:complete
MLVLSSTNAFHLPIIDNLPTIKQISQSLPYETRVKIVEEATGVLPKLDWFGHIVLTNNEKLIDNVIHTSLTDEQKKTLILKIVDLTRQGDQMGGKILLNYYNLIDNIL